MHDTRNTVNPAFAAAKTLVKLDDSGTMPTLEETEGYLERAAMRITQQDMGGLEELLSHQTYALNRLFTHTLDKYAANTSLEKAKIYSDLALRTQNNCRLNVQTLCNVRQTEERTNRLDVGRAKKLGEILAHR